MKGLYLIAQGAVAGRPSWAELWGSSHPHLVEIQSQCSVEVSKALAPASPAGGAACAKAWGRATRARLEGKKGAGDDGTAAKTWGARVAGRETGEAEAARPARSF